MKPRNRMSQWLDVSDNGSPPVADRLPELPTGFILLPSHLIPGPSAGPADLLADAQQRLYARALRSAREQAARVPAHRLHGFWNKGRSS